MQIKIMKQLISKYRAVILYLVFGVITTVINIESYVICYQRLEISNVGSNIIAWFLAVIIAYVTNKIWVFESKALDIKVLIHEVAAFFAGRIATGIMDLGLMYIMVDIFNINAMLMKLCSNMLVIITNYAISKLIVFRNTYDSAS